MWNKVRSALVVSIIAILPFSASAGDASGKVVTIMAHSQDVVFFSLDGPYTNVPACSSTALALSLSTQSGRAQYALLLSASAQGKVVYVHGTGNCAVWGDRETADYIYMN
ncbi:hypothetical protein [Xanthomonas sacchari]|uniref:hypothetical protein n=1 Tax=Xanthomonas sacchari TaxID=56458 RepID=UPI001110DD9A|nr:hypothetical protein [Xanthomonas sacchari]MDV0440147.1 hypothetical protein [Xanthomonas sacchari]